MNIIFPILAVVSGLCLSVQGPVNSALAKRTDKFQATMVSFFGGMLLLCLIVATIGKGDLSRITEAKPWQLLGGAYGVLGVCVSVAAIPVLGVALTVTVMMLGQIVTGAVIDYYGLFNSTPTAISTLRALGILTVAVGIVVIYFGSRDKESQRDNNSSSRREIILLLTFLCGVCGAIQSPTNSSLAVIIGNWESTLVSFATGFILILLITLVKNRGKLMPMRNVGIKPWMVIGGSYGVVVVFLNLFTVPHLGTALQVACGMAGQLLGGIVVDSFGLIQSIKVKVNALRMIGVVIIMAGVVCITLSRM